jgi:hypothetical protein
LQAAVVAVEMAELLVQEALAAVVQGLLVAMALLELQILEAVVAVVEMTKAAAQAVQVL